MKMSNPRIPNSGPTPTRKFQMRTLPNNADPTPEIDEVMRILERLNSELQDLLVRGLRVSGLAHLKPLRTIQFELQKIGAEHVSGRLSVLISAIEADQSHAASALLQTQASLRLFERILTLRAAEFALQAAMPDKSSEARQ